MKKNSEIAGLIITSEYFRGRQYIAIAHTKLYKLKHVPTLDNLNKLFRVPNCKLIFTKAASEIMQTNVPILITSLESMLDIALSDPANKEISLIYQKLSQDDQKIVKEEFFAGKLEKLIRTINSYDLISQFDIFKQIYNFIQENNINNEVNHKLFQYFKETLTDQPF